MSHHFWPREAFPNFCTCRCLSSSTTSRLTTPCRTELRDHLLQEAPSGCLSPITTAPRWPSQWPLWAPGPHAGLTAISPPATQNRKCPFLVSLPPCDLCVHCAPAPTPSVAGPPLRSRHLNPSNAGFTTGGPGGHQCCPIRVGRKRHKSRTATPPCPGPLPAGPPPPPKPRPGGGPGTGGHPGAPGHRLSSEAAFQRIDAAIDTWNPYNEGARTSCSSAWGREGLSSPTALYYGKN